MAMRKMYCEDCKVELTTDNEQAHTYPAYIRERVPTTIKGITTIKETGHFGRMWMCMKCWKDRNYENKARKSQRREHEDTDVSGKGYEGEVDYGDGVLEIDDSLLEGQTV